MEELIINDLTCLNEEEKYLLFTDLQEKNALLIEEVLCLDEQIAENKIKIEINKAIINQLIFNEL